MGPSRRSAHHVVSGSPGDGPRLPLSALLSQLLVAFTIEFDNTFERRMRDEGYKGHLSLAFWLGYGRHIQAGMTVEEFTNATRLSARDGSYLLAVVERWGHLHIRPADAAPGWTRSGYGTVQPIPADLRVWPTAQMTLALGLYLEVVREVEDRWVERFGSSAVARLRSELTRIADAHTEGLPWGLPDCAMDWSLGRLPPPTGRLPRSVEDRPLPALLSQVLWKFATEYNAEADVPIAVGASVLRVLDRDGVRVADLPQLTGISGFYFGGLLRTAGLFELASVSRSRVVRLTPVGEAERDLYATLVEQVEIRWDAKPLRNALLDLLTRDDLIAQGMEPPGGVPRAGDDTPELWVNGPTTVRKAVRALVKQTDAFMNDPRRALPHYPIWDGGRGFGP